MKTILPIIICITLALPQIMKAQQKVYDGAIVIHQNIAEIKNDSVYFDMDIVISGVTIPRNYSLLLVPVISAETDSLELPYIRLNGKHNHRMFNRSTLFNKGGKSDPDAYVIFGYDLSVTRVVSYRETFPYQPWMAECGLRLKGVFRDYNGDVKTTFYDNLTDELIFITENQYTE